MAVFDDVLLPPDHGCPPDHYVSLFTGLIAKSGTSDFPAWWTALVAQVVGLGSVPVTYIQPPVLLTREDDDAGSDADQARSRKMRRVQDDAGDPGDDSSLRVHMASEGYGLYMALDAGTRGGCIEMVAATAWPRGDDLPTDQDWRTVLRVPEGDRDRFLSGYMDSATGWAVDTAVPLTFGRLVVVRARKFFRIRLPAEGAPVLFCHIAQDA